MKYEEVRAGVTDFSVLQVTTGPIKARPVNLIDQTPKESVQGRACPELQEAAGECSGGYGVPGVLLVANGHQCAVKRGEQPSPHRKAAAYSRRLSPDRLHGTRMPVSALRCKTQVVLLMS